MNKSLLISILLAFIPPPSVSAATLSIGKRTTINVGGGGSFAGGVVPNSTEFQSSVLFDSDTTHTGPSIFNSTATFNGPVIFSSGTQQSSGTFTGGITVGGGAAVAGDIVGSSSVTVSGVLHIGYATITHTCLTATSCTASCPAGEQFTGGGCSWSTTPINTAPTNAGVDNLSWTCTQTASGTIGAYVTCARIN